MLFIVFLPLMLSIAAAGELLRAKSLQKEGGEYSAALMSAGGIALVCVAAVAMLGAAFLLIGGH